MNISYNWLKEYVNFDLTPDETAAALTYSFSIILQNMILHMLCTFILLFEFLFYDISELLVPAENIKSTSSSHWVSFLHSRLH